MNFFGLDNKITVHFIGIGGISMSSLAQILLNGGYKVTGSDINKTHITDKLEKSGAKIFIGHDKNNIGNAKLVVYTAAINKENPEYVEAIEKNIKTVERSVFLGELMKNYKDCCCISGTHGKTTTTSMTALIMLETNFDPTILIGGELKNIDGNIKIGSNDVFVTEACEYVESFLEFFPTKAIISNIDEDHLDYFKDINHIISAFNKFAKLIPSDGILVVNGEDKNTQKALNGVKCKVIKYGLENTNDYYPLNLECDASGMYSFKLMKNNECLGEINLNVPGIHNIYNALSSAALCFEQGCTFENVKNGLEKFTGTGRRFETKGSLNGATIIDDYAHHPTEIKATLSVCKNMDATKTIAVFQPHTYSRTKALLSEFSESFFDADEVIIADIYAAREKDDGTISSKDLAEKLINNGVNAKYIKDRNEIEDYLKKQAAEKVIIITIGAGDVFKIGENILK